MAMRTTRNSGRRTTGVSRLSAVCALTGAALLATVTGGQAWADGGAPVAPAPKAPAAGADTGSGAAVKESAPAPATPTARPTAAPAPATPSAGPQKDAPPRPAEPGAAPSVAPGPGTGPAPVHPKPPTGTQPQVREVPKGAAQAGDGSGADDSSGLKLAGGGAVAALGAGALGFAVLRRRSGARG